MWKIRNRIDELQARNEIVKHKKLKKENQNSNIVATRATKMYEYYKCDYCEDEIRLDVKQSERSGGIITIPKTIVKRGKLKLVLCNKCLKPVLREFQD